jgi:two-component system sensor histidine kinase YesM
MKWSLKLKESTIYPKLVFSFLLAIVPLYGLSLVMNEYGARNVSKSIESSISSQTGFYLESFENEINRLVKLNRQFTVDDDLQRLGILAPALTEFDRTQSIIQLQSKLRIIISSSLYVSQAEVYIPLIDKTIYPGGYSGPMAPDEWLAVRNASVRYDSPITYWNGQYILGQAYPEYAPVYRQPVFALKVALSEKEIRQSLERVKGIGLGGEAALIHLSDNGLIATQEDSKVLPEMKKMAQAFKSKDRNGSVKNRVDIDGVNYFINVAYSSDLNIVLAVAVPESEILGPTQKYRVWFWTISGISLFVVIFFSYWIYSTIHRPLKTMVKAFREVERGELGIVIDHHHRDEFQYMYRQFNAMVKRLNVLVHEVYEQQIRSQRSELKQLQSQINPHFLYNSLFVLHQMAEMQDFENAKRFSKHLGSYFKFITRSASDEVTLAEEVNHARSYVEIQSMRFYNRIRMEWEELPEACRSILVPRLIIQPIIENAYEHGLEQRVSNGIIRVTSALQAGVLVITIEDNGDHLTDEMLDSLRMKLDNPADFVEITGIVNVHRRLRIKFGPSAGLVLSRAALGGLRVDIKIPLEGGV